MFQIDILSRTPVYEQLIQQLTHFILSDLFAEEQQIPSVRSVSMEHSINPRTVLKAYADLDAKGVIRSVPGKGYFVCTGAKERLMQSKIADLHALTDTLREMAAAGVPKEKILACVETAYSLNHTTTKEDFS